MSDDSIQEDAPEESFGHPSNKSGEKPRTGSKGNRAEQQRRYRQRHASNYRAYMRRYMAARRRDTLLTNE